MCRAAGLTRCRNGEPTAAGRKIDYVFADRRNFTVKSGDAKKFAESDHAMIRATFTLTAS